MGRKLAIVIFLCMCGFLLAACAGTSLVPNGEVWSEDEAGNEKATVVEFWHTYSEIETEVFVTKVLPLFEQEHPGIKIKAVRKDYTGQLKNNTLAAAADNKQPDVMRMDMIWVPEFAKNGVIVDLSDMEGFSDIRDRFIGSLLNTALYRNKPYGLPVNAVTKAGIYNRKLLEAAGLSGPPRTLNELIAAVQRLQRQDPEIYGLGICCSNSWGTLPYFWTFGGRLTDELYTRASGYLDSPESLHALAKLKRLHEDRIMSPSMLNPGGPGTWEGLLNGKLLMIDEGHWFHEINSKGEYRDRLQDIVVGPLPSDVRSGTSLIGGENLILFNGSKHKAEAWTFMKWMVAEKAQQIMAGTGLIPTIKNMKATNDNPIFAPYLKQLDNAMPRPPVSTWSDIDDIYARMIERILSNEQPLEEAVKEAVLKIDVLLANQ